MTDPTETIPSQKPPLFDQLKNRLNDTLADYGGESDEEILAEQSRILDRMFRHLVERSTFLSRVDDERLRVALKTQNQYRHTVKEIAKIKETCAVRNSRNNKT